MNQQAAERFSHFASRPPCRDATVRRSVEGGPRPLATGTGSVTDSNVTEKESGFLNLTVFYKVKTISDLENYFDGYAHEMREEGLSAFPGKFEASRRVHSLVEELN